ncbi:MAG TPA: hypothetical protein VLR88_01015 [Propionibacteriaceae bacterium]|nr:hypothetical protein [Propionibacteriaceae bacterium]
MTEPTTSAGQFPHGEHHTPSLFQHPWVFAGVLASLAVIGAAGVGGFWLSQRDNASNLPPGAVANPWPMVLPDSVGEFSKNPGSGESQTTSSAPPKTTVSGTYSRDGQTSVLVLLSRPDADPEAFLKEAAFTSVIRQDDGFCGVSADNALDGCVVERDGTSILAVGLIDQSQEELLSVAETFADAVSK